MATIAPFDSGKAALCCRIAVALCLGEETLLAEILLTALQQGLTPEELREIILTSYLFDGYPTALEGFRILGKVLPNAVRSGEDCHYSLDNVTEWRRRGEALCRTIYGPQYAPLMNRLREFAPELHDAMIVEGYGKTLARDGLDIRYRELAVVAILALKMRPRQLLSHLLGAMRVGVPRAIIRDAVGASLESQTGEHLKRFESALIRAESSFKMS